MTPPPRQSVSKYFEELRASINQQGEKPPLLKGEPLAREGDSPVMISSRVWEFIEHVNQCRCKDCIVDFIQLTKCLPPAFVLQCMSVAAVKAVHPEAFRLADENKLSTFAVMMPPPSSEDGQRFLAKKAQLQAILDAATDWLESIVNAAAEHPTRKGDPNLN